MEANTVRAPDLLFRLELDPGMRMGQNLEQLHYLFVLTFIALVDGRVLDPRKRPMFSFLSRTKFGEFATFWIGFAISLSRFKSRNFRYFQVFFGFYVSGRLDTGR